MLLERGAPLDMDGPHPAGSGHFKGLIAAFEQAAAEKVEGVAAAGYILQRQRMPVGHDGVADVGGKGQRGILEGHIRVQQDTVGPNDDISPRDGHILIDDPGSFTGHLYAAVALHLDGVAVLHLSLGEESEHALVIGKRRGPIQI